MLTHRMLPRVDLPEVLLEVLSWTGADQAFTSVTGGEARLADLHISIAALLVSESCNIGWTSVVKHAVPALTHDRLAQVDATYLRMDTLKAANGALIDEQARIGLAQIWAAGMWPGQCRQDAVRRTGADHQCPPQSPLPGPETGRDLAEQAQRPGRRAAGKVVAGTPRDSLHVLDVLYDRDGPIATAACGRIDLDRCGGTGRTSCGSPPPFTRAPSERTT